MEHKNISVSLLITEPGLSPVPAIFLIAWNGTTPMAKKQVTFRSRLSLSKLQGIQHGGGSTNLAAAGPSVDTWPYDGRMTGDED